MYYFIIVGNALSFNTTVAVDCSNLLCSVHSDKITAERIPQVATGKQHSNATLTFQNNFYLMHSQKIHSYKFLLL